MMNPEFPLTRNMTAEQKRTFLFTYMRPKNEEWIDQIKKEIEYCKNQKSSTLVCCYGAPLVINENIAANLKIAVSHFEDYLTPDPYILLSEEIPAWFVFDHCDNKEMNHFLRMLIRRDVLNDLGFSSSSRNGTIEKISWETRQRKDEESGKEINYFITESPNDPRVFLIRTLWPPREGGRNFVFSEHLFVSKDKQSAVADWEIRMGWEVNKTP